MEKRQSNYETTKQKMRRAFAAGDMDTAAREWELEPSGGDYRLVFAGREYRLRRTDGAILYDRNGETAEADFNVCMTLYDILTRPRAAAGRELRPISAFSDVQSASVGSGSFFGRARAAFDHHDRELAAACRELGGEPFGKGDVSFAFPVFRDLRAGLRFWSSDEEFGAELTMFCDENVLRFMHFETMMFMMVHLTGRLQELMEEERACE